MNDQPDQSPQTIIEFENVSYRLPNGQTLLYGTSFAVPRGETLVLLGRSGAGKTTALKLINRLLEPSAGELRVEGRETRSWDAIALRRRIGYVIQEGGLFPHYTIEENIALVPLLEKWPSERIRPRVHELLALVGLDPKMFSHRYPHQLSEVNASVGVARALAADPPILLMDEPFGALDPLTRSEIHQEFRELQRKLGRRLLYSRHQRSASAGATVAAGRRKRPGNLFAAKFLKSVNRWRQRMLLSFTCLRKRKGKRPWLSFRKAGRNSAGYP